METFCQISINVLLEQGEETIERLANLQKLFYQKRKIEKEWHSSLLNMSQKRSDAKGNNNFLFINILDDINQYHANICKDVEVYIDDMSENVINLFQGIKANAETHYEGPKRLLKKAKNNYSKAYEGYQCAKKKFYDAKKAFESSKMKYIEYEQIIEKKNIEISYTCTTSGNTISDPMIAKDITGASSSSNNQIFEKSNRSNSSNSNSNSLLTRFTTTFDHNPSIQYKQMKDKCLKRYMIMREYYDEMNIKKQELSRQINDYETIIDKMTKSIELFHVERCNETKACLKSFINLEKECLNRRLQHIIQLEYTIKSINIQEEKSKFIQQYKQPERTHRYSRALYLFDWDIQRRLSGHTDYECARVVRSLESYLDNSTWNETISSGQLTEFTAKSLSPSPDNLNPTSDKKDDKNKSGHDVHVVHKKSKDYSNVMLPMESGMLDLSTIILPSLPFTIEKEDNCISKELDTPSSYTLSCIELHECLEDERKSTIRTGNPSTLGMTADTQYHASKGHPVDVNYPLANNGDIELEDFSEYKSKHNAHVNTTEKHNAHVNTTELNNYQTLRTSHAYSIDHHSTRTPADTGATDMQEHMDEHYLDKETWNDVHVPPNVITTNPHSSHNSSDKTDKDHTHPDSHSSSIINHSLSTGTTTTTTTTKVPNYPTFASLYDYVKKSTSEASLLLEQTLQQTLLESSFFNIEKDKEDRQIQYIQSIENEIYDNYSNGRNISSDRSDALNNIDVGNDESAWMLVVESSPKNSPKDIISTKAAIDHTISLKSEDLTLIHSDRLRNDQINGNSIQMKELGNDDDDHDIYDNSNSLHHLSNATMSAESINIKLSNSNETVFTVNVDEVRRPALVNTSHTATWKYEQMIQAMSILLCPSTDYLEDKSLNSPPKSSNISSNLGTRLTVYTPTPTCTHSLSPSYASSPLSKISSPLHQSNNNTMIIMTEECSDVLLSLTKIDEKFYDLSLPNEDDIMHLPPPQCNKDVNDMSNKYIYHQVSVVLTGIIDQVVASTYMNIRDEKLITECINQSETHSVTHPISPILTNPLSDAMTPTNTHTNIHSNNTYTNDSIANISSSKNEKSIMDHLQDIQFWNELLLDKMCRDYFLHCMEEKRSTHALLTSQAFNCISIAMLVGLNYSYEYDDVKTAMRIANMANTLYVLKSDYHSIDSTASSSTSVASTTSATSARSIPQSSSYTYRRNSFLQVSCPNYSSRFYLQEVTCLRHHPIWYEEGFWDACLLSGLAQELDHSPIVIWENMTSEKLHEAILGIHNTLFGQLGALAFNMREVGLNYADVNTRIYQLSRVCQLGEEQINDLLLNIQHIFEESSI